MTLVCMSIAGIGGGVGAGSLDSESIGEPARGSGTFEAS